jgi:integrase
MAHLTSRFCTSTPCGVGTDGKPVQKFYPDDAPRSLNLRVSAALDRTWYWRGRLLDGTQVSYLVGLFVSDEQARDLGGEPLEHPPLVLKAARREALKIDALVRAGGDPRAAKREAKAKRLAEPIKSFGDLADAFLTASEDGRWKPRRKQKRPRTIADERKILDRNIRPMLGKLRLEDVDRRAIRRITDGMIERKIGAQTNRTLAVIRQVLAYGVHMERLSVNAAAGIAKPAEEQPRTRVLTDAELKTFWTACQSFPEGLRLPSATGEPRGRKLYVSRAMRISLQLAALLLVRRNEIAGMRVSELDLDNATWLIPGERMKGGKPHLIPLPGRALELIREAMAIAAVGRGTQPEPAFPSPRAPTKTIRPDSVTHAMDGLLSALGVASASPHDLRRTGATIMASERLGIAPHVVSRVLSHSSDNSGAALVTMRHYAIHNYAPEKRRAFEAWEGLLLEIVGDR